MSQAQDSSQTQDASQPQNDMAGRIFQALQLVKMPIEMYEFRKSVERLMFWRDDNPRIEQGERLDREVEHVIEHHVDTLVCDGREFEVEAVYEVYYVYCGDSYRIVHSFKPIRIQKRKEPKLKPKLKPEEWTPAEAVRFLLSAGVITLGSRILDEVLSEDEEKQSQTQEAKTQQS